MSPDLPALEANLQGLRPAALEGSLLARLEDSANGTLTTLTPAEAHFENSLRQVQPAPLPPALMAALEAALAGPAATQEATIIPFPASAPAPAARSRPMLAAAAAVALLGAAAALFVPGKRPQPTAAASGALPPPEARPVATAPAAPASRYFVPAGINTGLSQATDEGVLWQSKDQPRRVVKVVYWDRVTFVNPQGEKIEYEQPRVEYILVPEKID